MIQGCKIPSSKTISNGFCIVTVRVLNSYKLSKIRTFDSLHIVTAEAAKADAMLTTDDKLKKMAEKLDLNVKVMNPLKFAWEVI